MAVRRGDGRLDDCLGDLRVAFASTLFAQSSEVPDGRPDLYVQNPAWEEILLVGNFNTADYRAWVLVLVR